MKAVGETWVPRPDQIPALEWAVAREAAAIFGKPGSGKTAIAYKTLDLLQDSDEAKSAVVIVPLRPLYSTWPAENIRWRFGMSIGILHGPNKAKVLQEKHDAYLINPEGVDWLVKQKIPPWIDTLFVDESHKFKNSQTVRFKALRTILHLFKNRYVMSGTPQTRSIEDLCSQIIILDGGKRLGKFITHFRREFMVNAAPPRASYSDWQAAPGAEDEVYRRIADLAITIESTRTEKPVWNPIAVPMPAGMKVEYKRMEEHFYADLRAGRVSASNAGAKSMKLRQMTGGFVYDEDRAVMPVHSAKLDATVDYIEELGSAALIIAVNFDHEATALRARLKHEFGRDVPYFGGSGLKGKEAAAAIERWNAGKTPILMVNPAGAEGLNLQFGGSNVLWYSLTYNWSDYEQLNARVDRPGQTEMVTISALLMDGSVDHLIVDVLDSRGQSDKTLFTKFREHYENARR